MIESRIIGRNGVDTADVSSDGFLYTISKDLYKSSHYISEFSNDTFGNNLAINASPSGTPEPIHNGTDNAYWTASSIAGTWDFASTTQFYDGSRSIDGTSTIHNNIAQFAKGSNLDLSTYSSLRGWIYITSWPVTGTKQLNIYGWNTGTGTQVGNTIDIGGFIVKGDVGIWQPFTIPLSTLGLTGQTIDAIRIGVISLGTGTPIDFYLDNMEFQSAGVGPGVQRYSVLSEVGKVISIQNISWNFVSAYDISLADASVPNLSYDKLINHTLTDGMTYREIVDGVVVRNRIIKNLLDLIETPNSNITNIVCDGTNTYLKVEWNFNAPVELHYGYRDRLRITVSDNLSVFKVLNVRVDGSIRDEVNGS